MNNTGGRIQENVQLRPQTSRFWATRIIKDQTALGVRGAILHVFRRAAKSQVDPTLLITVVIVAVMDGQNAPPPPPKVLSTCQR